jgi:hypothetical protein
MSRSARGRSAWLVTWEWMGDHAQVSPPDVVAGIFSPRLGYKTIMQLVETLYAAREYDATDKLSALTHNPYKAHLGTIQVKVSGRSHRAKWQGEVICGHNPFLHARLVDGLRTSSDDAVAGLTWTDRARPEPAWDDY